MLFVILPGKLVVTDSLSSSSFIRDAVSHSARKLGSDLQSSSITLFEILSYTLPGVRKCRDSLPQVEAVPFVIIIIDTTFVDWLISDR